MGMLNKQRQRDSRHYFVFVHTITKHKQTKNPGEFNLLETQFQKPVGMIL